MELTVLDRSNYLKGLLILIGKDKKITDMEKELFLHLSEILGFNKEFCEDAISELFENEYIIEEPPAFSNQEIAKAFIRDGMRIAFTDKELHLYELNWIKSIGDKNNIQPEWRLKELENVQNSILPENQEFEISKLMRKA